MIKLVKLHKGQTMAFIGNTIWLSVAIFAILPVFVFSVGEVMGVEQITITWICAIIISLGLTSYLLCFIILLILVIGTIKQ